MKYTFNPGEDIPAESFQTLDPDNLQPQTAGYLTGGTSPSAYTVFEALRAGANNGKIKASINGVVYDNIAVDLNDSPSISASETTLLNYLSDTIAGYTDQVYPNNSQYVGQCFNSGNAEVISSIEVNVYSYTGNNGQVIYELRQGNGVAGTLLGSIQSGTITPNGNVKLTFGTQIAVSKNTDYTILVKWYRSAGGTYANLGVRYSNNTSSGYYPRSSTADTTKRMIFAVYSKGKVIASNSDVAVCVQAAIRTATGKTETVIYDTDHFVITSSTAGRNSKVLKFMSPTTGTDISGAGATPYLDMADNGVETFGDGDDYKLVRFDKDGKLPQLPTHTGDNQIVGGRAINTVYQNTKKVPIFVNASVKQQSAIGSGVVEIHAKIGTTSTPATSVARYTCSESGSSMAQTIPLSFIVPAGYYYTVSTVGGYSGSPALTSWFECDLI